ncbi:aminopeptidase N isoform X2 [Cimex lectularius]|uniref:Aminopeptidase n=1 Tax=Cimex lectularius TaxID=79782 RepID=A0A8I6R744_CIMLE|nr:aminopeptidase N isoform X2 [Cimex lectularius]
MLNFRYSNTKAGGVFDETDLLTNDIASDNVYFNLKQMLWLLISIICGLGDEGSALPGYRLPQDVKPTAYNLSLVTDLDTFKFQGNVEIKVKCLKATNSIVMHSNDLFIPESEVNVFEFVGTEMSPVGVTSCKEVPENEFLIIKLAKSLKPNKEYTLQIPFRGNLTQTLVGYYRSSYFDRTSNKTKWLGVTQFEAIDARRAFPCFDEPEMKAKFTIQLGHRKHLKAISNMPQLNQVPMEDNEWVWSNFAETVPMSTYLVAWVVSEFDKKVAPDNGDITFRIWAREEAVEQVDFASEVGPKVLKHFEKLFDLKYPLPKVDMAAIPDFASGAMENWGLITYRETDLLYIDKQSSLKGKERVAIVIAHELAHQWFGNLVTMKWWTDLWLNEGFATYVGCVGVNYVFPEWNYDNNTALDNIGQVFEIDSLKSSHKISVKIGHPSEINEIFDTISYKKGSAIIRMMHKFLGESFFKGVSNYLKEYKFGNAEQDNLWESLTSQAHKDRVLDKNLSLKPIMDSWTLQTGYPVLTVKRDYEKGTATITQTRFLRIPDDTDKKENCWWIPITYTTSREKNFSNTYPNVWFNCLKEKTLELTGLPKGRDNWLILNIDLSALYRVQYDDNNWKMIIKTLKSDNYKDISPLNRAGLILDVFAFARRGDLPYNLAFELVSYLTRETEYLPFSSGFSSFSPIVNFLKRTPGYGVLINYIKQLMNPFFQRYGQFDQQLSSLDEKKMHKTTISWACLLEEPNCISQANSLYNLWTKTEDLTENNPIPTDIQKTVLCTVVRYGGYDVWENLWNRYRVSNYGFEKSVLLSSLACSRDVWVINRYLDWSIDENSEIRRQDAMSIFSSITSNENGFYIAKDFLHSRIDDIHKFYKNHPSVLGKYLQTYGSRIVHHHELQVFKEFLNKYSKSYFKDIKLQAAQSLENAEANVKWLERNYKDIIKMLSL